MEAIKYVYTFGDGAAEGDAAHLHDGLFLVVALAGVYVLEIVLVVSALVVLVVLVFLLVLARSAPACGGRWPIPAA